MAGKQEYNQLCPIASALDVIGSRWALLVIRELALGPRRFGDILNGLETASTDMVTSRLRELEAAGLVERTDDRRYQLTADGLALGPVMRSMVIWSLRTGALGTGATDGGTASNSPGSIGPDPVRRLVGLLSLIARTTSIDAEDATIALNVGELSATVRKGERGYRITAGGPESPDGAITISPDALLALVVSGKPTQPSLTEDQAGADSPTARRVLADLTDAMAAVHAEIAQPAT